jgi:hypothetical protein
MLEAAEEMNGFRPCVSRLNDRRCVQAALFEPRARRARARLAAVDFKRVLYGRRWRGGAQRGCECREWISGERSCYGVDLLIVPESRRVLECA